MTGVQTCALPICFPVTIVLEILEGSRNLSQSLSVAFEDIGVSMTEADVQIIDVVDKLQLRDLARKIKELNTQQIGELDESTIVLLEEQILKLKLELEKGINKALIKTQPSKANTLGEQFADNIINTTINNIKSVFSSDMSVKEFIESTLDVFTNSVINAFIEGLMDPLTGQDGLIRRTLKDFFAGMFNEGQVIGKDVKGNDSVSKAFEQLKTNAGSFVTDFTNSLKGGFEFLKDNFKGVFDFAKEAFSGFSKVIGDLFSNIDFGVLS